MQPLKTLSLTPASLGTLSPVTEETSIEDEPAVITPSIGIISPGFTIIVSPVITSLGLTLSSFPHLSASAYKGRIFISFSIDLTDLSTDLSCR